MAEPMTAERLARIREMCSSWSFIADQRRHPAATFAIELLVERDRLAAIVDNLDKYLFATRRAERDAAFLELWTARQDAIDSHFGVKERHLKEPA